MKVISFNDYKKRKTDASEYREHLVSQVVSYYSESTDEEIGGDDFYINYLKENIPTYMLEEILERLKKKLSRLSIYSEKIHIFHFRNKR